MAVPLPLRMPVTEVDNVSAGVAPPLEVPASPLAETTETAVTVPPEPVADSVPVVKLTPEPIVTLLNPPVPLPYKIDVPLVAGALPLNVFQSVLVK